MMIQVAKDISDGYWRVTSAIRKSKQLCKTRGYLCREIRPYVIQFTDPGRLLYCGLSRKLDMRIAVVEALGWLYDYEFYDQLICLVNPGHKKFTNEDGRFDGKYGPHIRKAMNRVITSLKDDRDTRQAVIPIWSDDTIVPSKDVPCTISISFNRELEQENYDTLQMMVHMRSNDVNWGFPYDVFAFSVIQDFVAHSTGMYMGKYTHMVNSMHEYEEIKKGGPRRVELVQPDQEKFYQLYWPSIAGIRRKHSYDIMRHFVKHYLDYLSVLVKVPDDTFMHNLMYETFLEQVHNDDDVIAYFSHWTKLFNNRWPT